MISWCFPVTNARAVPLHEFIHSKYKTIHELDPTMWYVAGRIVAEKWRVSYTALALYLCGALEAQFITAVTLSVHNDEKFRYVVESGGFIMRLQQFFDRVFQSNTAVPKKACQIKFPNKF